MDQKMQGEGTSLLVAKHSQALTGIPSLRLASPQPMAIVFLVYTSITVPFLFDISRPCHDSFL